MKTMTSYKPTMVSVFVAMSLETTPMMTSEMRVIWEMGMKRMLKASDDQEEEVGIPPLFIIPGASTHQLPEEISDQRSRPQGRDTVHPNASTPMSVDPVAAIRDPRCHEATGAVLDAFMGLPPQEDPNHIRLWEPGLTLARKVFHPKD